MRMLRALPLLVLAACTPTTQAPVGTVHVGVADYPVTATPDGAVWRVLVDGQTVTCAHPTLEACTWSVRHHLKALDLLDDLGA